MALPKLDIPIYETTLPSGLTISFRPFLVKEEKILLMAAQSKDETMIMKSMIQILNNCIVDTIDITELPIYDIEYLFLQLRAKSVEEIVTLKYECANIVEGETVCKAKSEYKINLTEIIPKVDINRNYIVPLTEEIGLTLRDPKFSLFKKIGNKTTKDIGDMVEQVLEDCIVSIYDKEAVHYIKDVPQEEVRTFIDSLSPNQEKKIHEFFETMPKIEYDLNFKCPKCQHEEVIMLRGINDFFV